MIPQMRERADRRIVVDCGIGDQAVIEDQVAIARLCMARDPEISTQRRLNVEMSAHSLFQSFGDRERLQKIQGLLNECMTFLDDELSVITGPYEDLLSIDDVIELAEPILKHRMALTFAARAEGETIEAVIGRLKARIG